MFYETPKPSPSLHLKKSCWDIHSKLNLISFGPCCVVYRYQKSAATFVRNCAFVYMFWIAGSPSLVASQKCPPLHYSGTRNKGGNTWGISSSRPEKIRAHLLTGKATSCFSFLAQSIVANRIFQKMCVKTRRQQK